MGSDERELVENKLLRTQQLVFDSNPETSRVLAVENFRKQYNKAPNFDNIKDLKEVDKFARVITKATRAGRAE